MRAARGSERGSELGYESFTSTRLAARSRGNVVHPADRSPEDSRYEPVSA
jgi:hypothetical protein